MTIHYPSKCYRDRKDCQPFHVIASTTTKKKKPKSFVCCGQVDWKKRAVPQDAYRLCWKNSHVDEMGEYDESDLSHTMAVLAQALAVINAQRTNGELIQTPSD